MHRLRACPYTLASLQGNYAVIGTYGANVAVALAIRNFDGAGNLTGAFIVNEPTAGSTTGARTIVTGTQAGTYVVNCDGTGVITRVLTTGGVSTNQMDNFVITGTTQSSSGVLIASTLFDVQQTPSAIVAGEYFSDPLLYSPSAAARILRRLYPWGIEKPGAGCSFIFFSSIICGCPARPYDAQTVARCRRSVPRRLRTWTFRPRCISRRNL